MSRALPRRIKPRDTRGNMLLSTWRTPGPIERTQRRSSSCCSDETNSPASSWYFGCNTCVACGYFECGTSDAYGSYSTYDNSAASSDSVDALQILYLEMRRRNQWRNKPRDTRGTMFISTWRNPLQRRCSCCCDDGPKSPASSCYFERNACAYFDCNACGSYGTRDTSAASNVSERFKHFKCSSPFWLRKSARQPNFERTKYPGSS